MYFCLSFSTLNTKIIYYIQGKHIDKDVLNAIKPAKLRTKSTPSRPRPKTIHVDAASELDSGVLTPSRGKKGSSSNLSTGMIKFIKKCIVNVSLGS